MNSRTEHHRTPASGITALLSRHVLIVGIVVVLLLTVFGVLITTQGWKSRVPPFDILTYVHSANEFLTTGAPPQHGDTGSLGSFKPAGTAWLMMPSLVLFDDIRLVTYVGTGLLHLLTVLGVFLLARFYFGNRCAVLAVLLYGVSFHALFLAGSLWPNGRPEILVWMIYLTTLWVHRNDSRFLAAALTVWAVGMHIDMAHTPAFFIIPAVWLYHRPPISLRPLLAGGIVAIAVWLPYLRFQSTRDFVDIRSQLLLTSIHPENVRDAWCNPALALRSLTDTASQPTSGPENASSFESSMVIPLQYLADLVSVGWAKLISNYATVAPIPGASSVLLAMTIAGFLALTVTRAPQDDAMLFIRPHWRPWTNFIALLMIVAAVVSALALNVAPGLAGGLDPATMIRLQTLLIVGGIAILAEKYIAGATRYLLARANATVEPEGQANRVRTLALGLAIPWFLLLLMAEPGKPERFWWVWPVQIIFLAAFLTNVLPRLRVSRSAIITGQILVFVIVLANPFLTTRLNSWMDNGWSGQDAAEVQVVDLIASDLRQNGEARAPVGYQTFIYAFMAEYNIVNPQYKVGAEFDIFLDFRHGIENANQCAEGVSPEDRYRVVQITPLTWEGAPSAYFDVELDDDFRLLGDIGSHKVYKRD